MMRLSGLENRSETEIVGLKFKNDLTLSEKAKKMATCLLSAFMTKKKKNTFRF